MIRLRPRDDHGFSLVELIVVMTMFSAIMAMVFTILITLTNQARNDLAQSRAVDQARVGIAQIDRQVRSGNLIIDPQFDFGPTVSGVDAYYSMRLFTQVDGVDRCAQWRVYNGDSDAFADLQFRTWSPQYGVDGDVTEWYIVAENSVSPPVDVIDPNDRESWPPFWIDSTLPSGSEAQNIRITLRMQDPDARGSSKPVTVSTVVTGRNTVFGYPTSSCNDIPPP